MKLREMPKDMVCEGDVYSGRWKLRARHQQQKSHLERVDEDLLLSCKRTELHEREFTRWRFRMDPLSREQIFNGEKTSVKFQ